MLPVLSTRTNPTNPFVGSYRTPLSLEEGADVLEELRLDRVGHGGSAERRDLPRELVRGHVLEPSLLDDPLAPLLEFVAPPALDEALAQELLQALALAGLDEALVDGLLGDCCVRSLPTPAC